MNKTIFLIIIFFAIFFVSGCEPLANEKEINLSYNYKKIEGKVVQENKDIITSIPRSETESKKDENIVEKKIVTEADLSKMSASEFGDYRQSIVDSITYLEKRFYDPQGDSVDNVINLSELKLECELTGPTFYYYYEPLNDAAFFPVTESMDNTSTVFNAYKNNDGNIKLATKKVVYDDSNNDALLYILDGNKHYILPLHAITPFEKEYVRKQKETNNKAIELAKEVENKNYKTDYEKIKHVYDWFMENVTYADGNEDYRDGYTALIERKSQCGGMAQGFKKILTELKIPAKQIVNNSGSHTWNVVQLGDQWYNVDISSGALTKAGKMSGKEIDWLLVSDTKMHTVAQEFHDDYNCNKDYTR